MAVMRIGSARTYSTPTDWGCTPDDRQQLIPLIDGNTVEDYGHIESGDRINCTCLFTAENFHTVYGYWEGRTLVTVTDPAGNAWSNCRVLVKSYKYKEHFPHMVEATLEFWRI